jgi:hypothetical protein
LKSSSARKAWTSEDLVDKCQFKRRQREENAAEQQRAGDRTFHISKLQIPLRTCRSKLFFLPAEQAENDIYPEKSDDDRTLRLFSFVMLFLITLSRKLAKQRCRARLRRFEAYKPLNQSKLPEFLTVSI